MDANELSFRSAWAFPLAPLPARASPPGALGPRLTLLLGFSYSFLCCAKLVSFISSNLCGLFFLFLYLLPWETKLRKTLVLFVLACFCYALF